MHFDGHQDFVCWTELGQKLPWHKKCFKKFSKVKAKPMVTENLKITRKKSRKVMEFEQLKRVQTLWIMFMQVMLFIGL